MSRRAEPDRDGGGARGPAEFAVRLLVIAPTRRELAGLTASSARGVDVAVTGIGRTAAGRAAALLTRTPRPRSGMLSLGFAGALDPRLRAGDVVVASSFVPAGPPAPPGPLGPSAAAALVRGAGGPAAAGALLTVDRPLLRAAEKRRARSETGASAVDMEGAWIAETARAHGVPVLSLRAIIDEAAFELPAFVARIIDDGGRREWLHTLAALGDPRALRSALPLAARARRAARSLRRAADAVGPALLGRSGP